MISLVKINICFYYLGSDQGIKPLDSFTVRYEAVHPIYIQHNLTESWEREKERKRKILVNSLDI